MITKLSSQIILEIMTKPHNLPRYDLQNLQEIGLLVRIGIEKCVLD